MIIDLLNFCQYNPGTEAMILFRLQENGMRVPSFFCVTEDFTEDELNNYLSNHFQHTTNFTVRLSLSFEKYSEDVLSTPQMEPPHYVDIPKSMTCRFAERLFSDAEAFIEKNYPNRNKNGKITAHVIIQEMVHSDIFGCMQTACSLGVLNETIILVGEGHDADFEARGVPYSRYCHNDDDGILFAYEPENAPRGERRMLQLLLHISKRLKEMFHNCTLSVRFIADFEIHQFYLISVQKISEFSEKHPPETILDTKGICSYYPGVTLPLNASILQRVTRTLLRETFVQVSVKQPKDESIFDIFQHVNGRLYCDRNRLNRVKDTLSLLPEEKSPQSLFQKFFGKKRKTAARVAQLFEKNMNMHDTLCAQFQVALERLAAFPLAESSFEHLVEAFHETFRALTECLRANLFNMLFMYQCRDILRHTREGDKQHRHAAAALERITEQHKTLRAYHAKFMEQVHNYTDSNGEKFVQMGCISAPEDIYYLTLDEILAVCNGNCIDYRAHIEEKKRIYAWFRSMPCFTHLIFYGQPIDAPLGTVGFLDTLQETCYLRGSGLSEGEASKTAILCPDNKIPGNGNPNCIYVMKRLPDSLAEKTIGGLIVEECNALDCLKADMSDCTFPVVAGAEHACTLIHNGDLVKINGTTGKVCISCTENIGAVKVDKYR